MFLRHLNVSLAMIAVASSAGCHNGPDSITADGTLQRATGHPAVASSPAVAQASSRTADVRLTMGRLLEQQGKLEQAEKAYRAALAEKPDSHVPYWQLAIVVGRQGRLDESMELFNQALERSPGNPHLYSDAGYALYLHGQTTQAEMNYRQAIALQPTNERAQHNLGMLLAETGRLDESIAAFRAAKLDNASIEENIGLARIKNGDFHAARDCYQRASTLNPNSATARRGLRRVEDLIAASELSAKNALLASDRPSVAIAAKSQTPPPTPVPAATTLPAPAAVAAPHKRDDSDAVPAMTHHGDAQQSENLHRPRPLIVAYRPLESSTTPLLRSPESEGSATELPEQTDTNATAPIASVVPSAIRPIPPLPLVPREGASEQTRQPLRQTEPFQVAVQPLIRSRTFSQPVTATSVTASKLPVIQPADLPQRRLRTFDRPTGITRVSPWAE